MPGYETRKRRRALLTDARALVRKRYPEPDLTLADVARELCASPRQLQRVFREYGGGDFRGYLLRIRMERARYLLARERNPLSVGAAAHRVGYRQASGLRQAFRRHFGLNPSDVQAKLPHYLGTHTWDERGRVTVTRS